MANRRFTQFSYSMHPFPVTIDCNFDVGATGAVGTLRGPGVTSVTRLAVGTYKVLFQDNYNKFFGVTHWLASPNSGANVAVTAINPTTVYVITVVGTTTTAGWNTAGVPVGTTPAVGVTFLCAATTTGSGQAKVVGVSGNNSIEVVGLPNTTLQNSTTPGGYVVIQCLGPTNSSTTTQIPVDPANGSILGLSFYLSNSSLTVQGE